MSGRFGPRKLGSELRDSIFAFRDKGFTIGTVTAAIHEPRNEDDC